MNKRPPSRTDVIFLRDVPKDLKDMFKAYCALRGTSMKAEFVEFMKQCVAEDEDLRRSRK